MAITVELELAIAADRETVTITDSSTYTSPVRSAVGVFFQWQKVNINNSATNLTTTGNASDPETDASFECTYTDDGFYRGYYVAVPDFDSSGTLNIYDAVFNSADDKVYRSKSNNNTENDLTNTTYYEEISNPALLAANADTATESGNITSFTYLRTLSANSQYTYANLLSGQSPHEEDDDDESLRDYNVFALLLDQMAIADSREEVLDGEILARKVESRFINA